MSFECCQARLWRGEAILVIIKEVDAPVVLLLRDLPVAILIKHLKHKVRARNHVALGLGDGTIAVDVDHLRLAGSCACPCSGVLGSVMCPTCCWYNVVGFLAPVVLMSCSCVSSSPVAEPRLFLLPEGVRLVFWPCRSVPAFMYSDCCAYDIVVDFLARLVPMSRSCVLSCLVAEPSLFVVPEDVVFVFWPRRSDPVPQIASACPPVRSSSWEPSFFLLHVVRV